MRIWPRLMLQRDKEGRPFTFYHYMIDLKGGPCIYKRISGCGSGTEYMAVTPWGDLYPCHQFVGDEKFKLGDIWDGVDERRRAGGVCRAATCMHGRSAGTAGQGSTAPAAAPPTPTTPPAPSGASIRRRLRPVPQAHGVRHRRGGGP